MFLRLILALLFLVLLFYVYHKIKKAAPARRKKLIITTAIYLTIGLVVLAALTGRLHWLGVIPAAIAGIARFGFGRFFQLMPILNFFRANSGIKNPEFATPHLRVEWNVKTGEISGKILSGEYAEKQLHELSSSQLEQLLEQYKTEDKKSYFILKFFIQKTSGNTNKPNGSQSQYEEPEYSPASTDQLSLKEAYNILGVNKDSSKKDINSAYKRLIQKLHPDRGGNVYLASRVNLARDLLIKNSK